MDWLKGKSAVNHGCISNLRVSSRFPHQINSGIVESLLYSPADFFLPPPHFQTPEFDPKADYSDELLTNWTKPLYNPFLAGGGKSSIKQRFQHVSTWNGLPGCCGSYPLVNCYITMENGHRNSDFFLVKMWWFSSSLCQITRGYQEQLGSYGPNEALKMGTMRLDVGVPQRFMELAIHIF